MNPTENQEAKFHHLISGQILLAVKDDAGNEGMNSAFLNAVITTKDNLVGAHDIGRAQQTLQMLFFKKVPPEDQQSIKIIDVVIMGIAYLGYMTDERFLQKPDNVQLQERAKAALSLVASNDALPADPEAKKLD